MPSKIKPRPVRLGDEREALVNEHAKATGKSQHAAMLDLIDLGLEYRYTRPAPSAAAPVIGEKLGGDVKARAKARAKAAIKAATPGPETMHAGKLVPLAGSFERKPLQKAGQPKRKWTV